VLVAGRVIVQEGKVKGVDVDALLREARDMVASIRKRNSALQSAVQTLA
jgi:hypothetical protein